MNKKATKKILTKIILAIAIIVIIYLIMPKPKEIDKETAKCIGENSTIYIKAGCIACATQKSLFGSSFKYLNSIDCAKEPGKCDIANITAIPTWIINQKKLVGVQSTQTLKDLTGC